MSDQHPDYKLLAGDCLKFLPGLHPASIDLVVTSPPYHVGKGYEDGQSEYEWQTLLSGTIRQSARLLAPGAFMAINIADILCFADPSIPRWRAETTSRQKGISREAVLAARADHPNASRQELAAILGVSEQTVDRRLNGNNVRGRKAEPQTRVKLTGGLLEQMALDAGLYLYDRRVWVKDPAWESSRWHSSSYRAVDEFEYIYIFWRPGPTRIDRTRLAPKEWATWGSRAVWTIPSVRANDLHEAMFPVEIPQRLIRLLSAEGETVLDPFLGSGTTGVAALALGRKFIGIERDPSALALAEKNIVRVATQPSLFSAPPARPAQTSFLEKEQNHA